MVLDGINVDCMFEKQLANGSRCNQSPAEDHEFEVLQATWQVPNLFPAVNHGEVLIHSKERLVCKRCGKVVDAFPELEVGKLG